jgi:2-keto-4-pentenoate hydratase
MTDKLNELAVNLRNALDKAESVEPVRDVIGETDIDAAYKIQQINTEHWIEQGRLFAGRKIGLTSKAVQTQLGVDQPDYGILFKDMAYDENTEIDISQLIAPKIEAEIAMVVGRDLNQEQLTMNDLLGSIEYMLPALEIVDSRVRDWDIKITDTIADNASCGVYVLGTQKTKLGHLNLRNCGMVVENKGEPVSSGAGAACLGNPLNACLWLANKMIECGTPLKEGDLVLTGALGPMVSVKPGDRFNARIDHLGSVSARFSR